MTNSIDRFPPPISVLSPATEATHRSSSNSGPSTTPPTALSGPLGRLAGGTPGSSRLPDTRTQTQPSKEEAAAAVRLQAAWRGYAQRGQTNSSGYHEIRGEPQRDATTGAVVINRETGKPDRPIVAFAKYDRGTGRATQFLRNPLEPWEDGPGGYVWRMAAKTPAKGGPRYGEQPPKKLVAAECRVGPEDDDFPVPTDSTVLDILSTLEHVVVRHRVQETRVIMEEMDCDAQQAFQKDGPLPLSVFRGAIGDLKAFHQAGALHREIKPDNILLRDGVAYLSDFDYACAKDDAFQAPGDPFFQDARTLGDVDYAERYGQAIDDYAMLLSLLILTGHKNTASLAKKREAILLAEGRRGGKEGDLDDILTKWEAETSIREWASSYGRPDRADDILLLLDSATKFRDKYQEYQDQLHLYDMLKFE